MALWSSSPAQLMRWRAAIEFQQMMLEANSGQPEDIAIVFRIGLHLGDLIVEGDDLYGDAVNIAARLQAAGSGRRYSGLPNSQGGRGRPHEGHLRRPRPA